MEVAKCKSLAAQRKLCYRSVFSDEGEIPHWVDDAIHKAVEPQPERRYQDLFEFIHDLRKPNKRFINQRPRPLMEQHPLLFWQWLCGVLVIGFLLVLSLGRTKSMVEFSIESVWLFTSISVRWPVLFFQ